MDLSERQVNILEIIVNQYQETESPITGDEIADAVGLHPGSIRTQMQSLKAYDLVESITGPKGGYKPTVEAYRTLDRQSLDTAEDLTLAHDYTRIDATVVEIEFTSVNHPEQCGVRVGLQESVEKFNVGDPILIGPTPKTELVVGGEIESIDHGANAMELDVSKLEAPLSS